MMTMSPTRTHGQTSRTKPNGKSRRHDGKSRPMSRKTLHDPVWHAESLEGNTHRLDERCTTEDEQVGMASCFLVERSEGYRRGVVPMFLERTEVRR